jgi:hypothetical protein
MNVNEIRSATIQSQVLRPAQKRAAETPFHELVQSEAKESPAALTDSERQYFEGAFPGAADEVRSYNPSQRDGASVPARLGSLLDRRG